MSGFLGAGVGLRRPHVAALLDEPERGPPVLELTPSQWFGEPALLERIAAGRTIVLHDVLGSLATVGPIDAAHFERVAEVARRSEAIAYTDHLALTRSPGGIDLGHLVPVPRTRAQLEVLSDHVRAVADRLGLPVALELPATTLRGRGDGWLGEGEFVHALVEASGCELVLDLENLRVDAGNFAELAALPRLAALPLAAVSHVHLAGGRASPGWIVDSHGAPVPAATWALLAALRGRIEPRTIIVERDVDLPPWTELVAEADRAAAIWRDDTVVAPAHVVRQRSRRSPE